MTTLSAARRATRHLGSSGRDSLNAEGRGRQAVRPVVRVLRLAVVGRLVAVGFRQPPHAVGYMQAACQESDGRGRAAGRECPNSTIAVGFRALVAALHRPGHPSEAAIQRSLRCSVSRAKRHMVSRTGPVWPYLPHDCNEQQPGLLSPGPALDPGPLARPDNGFGNHRQALRWSSGFGPLGEWAELQSSPFRRKRGTHVPLAEQAGYFHPPSGGRGVLR